MENQTRSVTCVQITHNQQVHPVSDQYCTSPKPISTQTCRVLDCDVAAPDVSTDKNEAAPISREVTNHLPSQFMYIKSLWGDCSVTCGTGVQTRTISCIRVMSMSPPSVQIAPMGACTPPAPITSQLCNPGACVQQQGSIEASSPVSISGLRTFAGAKQSLDETYTFEVGEWRHCDRSCGSNRVKNRDVKCIKRSDTAKETVPSEYCGLPIPKSTKKCPSVQCSGVYLEFGDWTTCNALCGERGYETRGALCHNSSSDELVDTALCNVPLRGVIVGSSQEALTSVRVTNAREDSAGLTYRLYSKSSLYSRNR